MGKIKAIGFDFGGVIGGDPNVGHEFTKLSADLLGVTVAEWRKTYFSLNDLLNTGKNSKHEFWQRFLQEFDQTDKLEQVIAQDNAMSQRYLAINYRILSLIDKLRRNGYKVGLLSNATDQVAENIKRLDIESHFDSFLFSSEIGLQKPDIAAFDYLAKSLGANLADLVFIDDSDMSLRTSAESGFTAILFQSYDQLINDMMRLEVI